MSPKIFITGATGFIGGEILHQVTKILPSSPITALVRDKSKAKKIETTYPKVSLIEGDLDSGELIQDEAKKADIIINAANAKHIPSIQSIAKGIESTSQEKSTFWLQISGASLLSVPDIKNKSFGEASDKIYNDLNGAADIRKLIDENPSRATDQFLLNFVRAHSGKVRTALIFPPIIYGEGRGPGNTRSIQIPDLCKQAIEKKESVYVGKGEAIWGNVHITDLGSLAGYLVKASVDRQDEDDLFNENGLYFPATGGITWKAIADAIAQTANKNGIKATTKSLNQAEADEVFPHGSILFGTNARSEPGRAAKLFDYKATQDSLEQEIPITFERELKASKL